MANIAMVNVFGLEGVTGGKEYGCSLLEQGLDMEDAAMAKLYCTFKFDYYRTDGVMNGERLLKALELWLDSEGWEQTQRDIMDKMAGMLRHGSYGLTRDLARSHALMIRCLHRVDHKPCKDWARYKTAIATVLIRGSNEAGIAEDSDAAKAHFLDIHNHYSVVKPNAKYSFLVVTYQSLGQLFAGSRRGWGFYEKALSIAQRREDSRRERSLTELSRTARNQFIHNLAGICLNLGMR